MLIDSTTVLTGGVWTITGLSISVGSSITATCLDGATCGLESASSNAVVVELASSNAVTITSSPIVEGDASVSGTGTDGDVITLEVDGFPISGVSAVVAGGVWTIAGIPSYELYTTGIVTAIATTPGFCQSAPSASETVICIPPDLTLTADPDSVTICSGEVVANIEVQNSENLFITSFIWRMKLHLQVAQFLVLVPAYSSPPIH